MSSLFDEFSKVELAALAREVKAKLRAGKSCFICKEAAYMADKDNCLTNGKQVFACWKCRHNPINQVVFDLKIIE